MKYTAGPWQVAYDPGKYIVIGCKERGICIVPNEGGPDEHIRKGNAYLIATAPEMLEALEGAKWLIESYVSNLANNEEYQDICAVIKKARGEE